jgi:hypothetical protein
MGWVAACLVCSSLFATVILPVESKMHKREAVTHMMGFAESFFNDGMDCPQRTQSQ